MIEAEDLLDGDDVRLSPAVAARLTDGLLLLARAAVTASSPRTVPDIVVALIDALQASARRVSDVGSGGVSSVIVDGVQSSWVTAGAAGERVGLSSRRVRQLAASGVIASPKSVISIHRMAPCT
mgnify:CR=1 FL=1